MECRTPFRRYALLALVCTLLVIAAGGANAQTASEPRDPQALAERYLGYTGAAVTTPLTPLYRVGDSAEFWVGKSDSETPVRVSATLAAAAPNIYLWVEEGIAGSGNLQQRAAQFSNILAFYRQRDNYRELPQVPSIGELSDPNDQLPVPDADNDPHIFILFTSSLREDREAVLNPMDSLPTEFAPYSNQHEMIYVNTSSFSGTTLSDPVYASIIVRGLYRWVMTNSVPEQPLWLTEALNWGLLFSIQQTPVSSENLSAFLQAPDTSLLQTPSLTTQAQVVGGQQLFLAYLLQRYGDDPYTNLFLQTGDGIAPVDAALAAAEISDPASGAPVTGRDAFADFVLANALNTPFGDGRYVQGIIEIPQTSTTTPLTPGTETSGLSVSQFGAQLYSYTARRDEVLKVAFNGSETAARLPMPLSRAPEDRFYWSGGGDERNPTLTRAVDLSGVESATLTFDAWYDFAPNWNYGYVSVSTDGGATWAALPAAQTTTSNRYGAAYGVGFTGISNPAEPRPFPILGVVIGGDSMTATDVSPSGPAAEAGIRPGDVIIGYDGAEWTSTPNIIGLLAEYAPGETLSLLIQRGSQQIMIPVLLGAHPTRIVEPAPIWLAQSVDLTPYAGGEILLRFEAVTLPGQEDAGFVLDNLAIDAIGWSDDAESEADGWTLDGWQQVDNRLRQQWLVQAVTGGTQTIFPRVQRLIDWDDESSRGEWRIAVSAGESLLLAVSGVSDETGERASFSLGVEGG